MLLILLFAAIFVVLLIVDIIMLKVYSKRSYDTWLPALSIISGIVLLCSIIALPLCRESNYQDIEGFKAIQETVTQQREIIINDPLDF